MTERILTPEQRAAKNRKQRENYAAGRWKNKRLPYRRTRDSCNDEDEEEGLICARSRSNYRHQHSGKRPDGTWKRWF